MMLISQSKASKYNITSSGFNSLEEFKKENAISHFTYCLVWNNGGWRIDANCW